MRRSLAVGLSLAVVVNAAPLRAQTEPAADTDASAVAADAGADAADAAEEQDPLARLTALEMEAADDEAGQDALAQAEQDALDAEDQAEASDADADAADPARDPRAWRALAQARLTRLARVVEAYRHPAQLAEPGFQALVRKIVPAPLADRMGDRRRALEA
ncbi:MAG: hypothetical protein HY079_01065, partial [Elusimicrobia bacterium]|nr:hypothetical protein [Elusimicrobiota bacterium]